MFGTKQKEQPQPTKLQDLGKRKNEMVLALITNLIDKTDDCQINWSVKQYGSHIRYYAYLIGGKVIVTDDGNSIDFAFYNTSNTDKALLSQYFTKNYTGSDDNTGYDLCKELIVSINRGPEYIEKIFKDLIKDNFSDEEDKKD